MKSWQLQEAKARLSELVKRAASDGPQEITVHGQAAVVVVSADEFARMTSEKSSQTSLWEILKRAPIGDEDLVIERDPDTKMREIES